MNRLALASAAIIAVLALTLEACNTSRQAATAPRAPTVATAPAMTDDVATSLQEVETAAGPETAGRAAAPAMEGVMIEGAPPSVPPGWSLYPVTGRSDLPVDLSVVALPDWFTKGGCDLPNTDHTICTWGRPGPRGTNPALPGLDDSLWIFGEAWGNISFLDAVKRISDRYGDALINTTLMAQGGIPGTVEVLGDTGIRIVSSAAGFPTACRSATIAMRTPQGFVSIQGSLCVADVGRTPGGLRVFAEYNRTVDPRTTARVTVEQFEEETRQMLDLMLRPAREFLDRAS